MSEQSALQVTYSPSERQSVAALVASALLSLLSVLSIALFQSYKKLSGESLFPRTHVTPYYSSLLIANLIQSVGSTISLRWILTGDVTYGPLCYMQGGWKNAGNVATALWNLVIAGHIFNLLFLRFRSTRKEMIAVLCGVWSLVGVVVFVGPVAIQKEDLGPYFGVSGYWCWITDLYPNAQRYLEYLFMFLSAGLSFLIYILVFFRMRGNIVGKGRKMRIIHISRSLSWELRLCRDDVDSAMLKTVSHMIWYPVAYTLLVLPIALARLSAFGGHRVPFGWTVAADFVFNLNGFVNAVLLLTTRRIFPSVETMPVLETPRKSGEFVKGMHVTPFVMPASVNEHERGEQGIPPRVDSIDPFADPVKPFPPPPNSTSNSRTRALDPSTEKYDEERGGADLSRSKTDGSGGSATLRIVEDGYMFDIEDLDPHSPRHPPYSARSARSARSPHRHGGEEGEEGSDYSDLEGDGDDDRTLRDSIGHEGMGHEGMRSGGLKSGESERWDMVDLQGGRQGAVERPATPQERYEERRGWK